MIPDELTERLKSAGSRVPIARAIGGCLLGTAIGDSVGLCCEGLSKRRQRRLFGEITGPNLFFGRGMCSDDTEHACMTAQALLVSGGNCDVFTKSLAWQMKLWLLGVPAGIGYATLRAILKLWMGVPAGKSGVFSAGNGPAMRSAILGVCYGGDLGTLRDFVRASTVITHTDPKAEWGAMAVALAAYVASNHSSANPAIYFAQLAAMLGDEAKELIDLVARAMESHARGETTQQFAIELGLENGVSGYIYHTVPVVLHAWFCHPVDYEAGILEIVRCGGDTDTTAAILGGILGAGVGKNGIPARWVAALAEWPRTSYWIERLGNRLTASVCEQRAGAPLPLNAFGVLARNLLFLAVVLAHGFRRMLPPY